MAIQITKNGKKVWRGRVTKGGETKSRHFPTKKEAVAWEVQERKADWSKTDTEYLLIDFAQDYLDYSKSIHDYKTYDEKRRAFRKLFEAKDAQDCLIIDSSTPVNELKKDSILAALLVQYETRSGDAANKDRKNLVAAWNWGVKNKDLPESNPFQVEKFPEIRHPRYVPPEEDFWKVYNWAAGQDKVMLTTFLFTAARRSEIFRLKWEDIDFTRKTIRLYTKKRKGSSTEVDILPMTDQLTESLRWWRDNRTFKENTEHVFLCEEKTPFCSEYYGQPFKYRIHFMKRLCEKVNVKPFGFHAIRHLSASLMYDMGEPTSSIQFTLRHQSAKTTDIYLRSLGTKTARASLENLGRRMASGLAEMEEPPSTAVEDGS